MSVRAGQGSKRRNPDSRAAATSPRIKNRNAILHNDAAAL